MNHKMLEKCYRKEYTTRDPTLDFAEKCNTRLSVTRWNEIICGGLPNANELISLDSYIDRVSEPWSKAPMIREYSMIEIPPSPQMPYDLIHAFDNFSVNMRSIVPDYRLPLLPNSFIMIREHAKKALENKLINDYNLFENALNIAQDTFDGNVGNVDGYIGKVIVKDFKDMIESVHMKLSTIVLDDEPNAVDLDNFKKEAKRMFDEKKEKNFMEFRTTIHQLQFYGTTIRDYYESLDAYKISTAEIHAALKARKDLFVKQTKEYKKWVQDTATQKAIVMHNARSYFRMSGPEGHVNEARRITKCAVEELIEDDWGTVLEWNIGSYVGRYTLENWLKLVGVVYDKDLLQRIVMYLRDKPKRRKVLHSLFEVGGMINKQKLTAGQIQSQGISEHNEQARLETIAHGVVFNTRMLQRNIDLTDDKVKDLIEDIHDMTAVGLDVDDGKGGKGGGYDFEETPFDAGAAKQAEAIRKAAEAVEKAAHQRKLEEQQLFAATAKKRLAENIANAAEEKQEKLIERERINTQTAAAKLESTVQQEIEKAAEARRKAAQARRKEELAEQNALQKEQERLLALEKHNSTIRSISQKAADAATLNNAKIASVQATAAAAQATSDEKEFKKDTKDKNDVEKEKMALNKISEKIIGFENKAVEWEELINLIYKFRNDRSTYTDAVKSTFNSESTTILLSMSRLQETKTKELTKVMKSINDLYELISKYLLKELPTRAAVIILRGKLQEIELQSNTFSLAKKRLVECKTSLSTKFTKTEQDTILRSMDIIFRKVNLAFTSSENTYDHTKKSLNNISSYDNTPQAQKEFREELKEKIETLESNVKKQIKDVTLLDTLVKSMIKYSSTGGTAPSVEEYLGLTRMQLETMQRELNEAFSFDTFVEELKDTLEDDLKKVKKGYIARLPNENTLDSFIQNKFMVEYCFQTAENRAELNKILNDTLSIMKSLDDKNQILFYAMNYARQLFLAAPVKRTISPDMEEWVNEHIVKTEEDVGLIAKANELFTLLKDKKKMTEYATYTVGSITQLAPMCELFIQQADATLSMSVDQEQLTQFYLDQTYLLVQKLVPNGFNEIAIRTLSNFYHTLNKPIGIDFYFFVVLVFGILSGQLNVFNKDNIPVEVPVSSTDEQKMNSATTMLYDQDGPGGHKGALFDDYIATFPNSKKFRKDISYRELCYYLLVRRAFIQGYRPMNDTQVEFRKILGCFTGMRSYMSYNSSTLTVGTMTYNISSVSKEYPLLTNPPNY